VTTPNESEERETGVVRVHTVEGAIIELEKGTLVTTREQGTAGLLVIALSVIWESWVGRSSLRVAKEWELDVARVDVNVRVRESVVQVKARLLIGD
jgi:hypothetical protein